VLSALTVLGLTYAVLFTSLLGVRTVEVAGVKELSEDGVRQAAAIETGAPLIRLDIAGIAGRVSKLPRVASVDVERSFPGTVRLSITERTAVGAVKGAGGAHLVDATGKDYATVPEKPAGVPELLLSKAEQDDPATKALVGVLTQLPEKLRPEVLSASAQTGGDVRLKLSAGREVRWGGVADSSRKGAVLMVLLTRDGTTFDVSSPDLPTVS
jgi:cell division protein FtsQ